MTPSFIKIYHNNTNINRNNVNNQPTKDQKSVRFDTEAKIIKIEKSVTYHSTDDESRSGESEISDAGSWNSVQEQQEYIASKQKDIDNIISDFTIMKDYSIKLNLSNHSVLKIENLIDKLQILKIDNLSDPNKVRKLMDLFDESSILLDRLDDINKNQKEIDDIIIMLRKLIKTLNEYGKGIDSILKSENLITKLQDLKNQDLSDLNNVAKISELYDEAIQIMKL